MDLATSQSFLWYLFCWLPHCHAYSHKPPETSFWNASFMVTKTPPDFSSTPHTDYLLQTHKTKTKTKIKSSDLYRTHMNVWVGNNSITSQSTKNRMSSAFYLSVNMKAITKDLYSLQASLVSASVLLLVMKFLITVFLRYIFLMDEDLMVPDEAWYPRRYYSSSRS